MADGSVGAPAGVPDRVPGRVERAQTWVRERTGRLFWATLLCWAVPMVWGGWWWLLLVVLIPAGVVLQVGMVTEWEEKRAAERQTTATQVRPGALLDLPSKKSDRRGRRGSGSPGSGSARPRPAASGAPPSGAPAADAPAADAPVADSPVADSPVVDPPVVDAPVGMFTAGGVPARALAYAPWGQALAVGCCNGQVQLWAGAGTPDPVCVSTLTHPGALTALGFSPRGRLLVTAGAEGAVTVWDVSLPSRPVGLATVVHSGVGPPAAVHSVDVGADGRVATGGVDGRVVVWSLAEPRRPVPVARLALTRGMPREQEVTPTGVVRGVTAVGFSPDGRLLAAGGRLGSRRPVQVWDVTGPGIPRRVARLRPHRLHTFGGGAPVCHALAFSPRRPLLVTASEYDYQVHPPYDYAHHPHCHDSAVVGWDLHDPARPEGLVTLAERGGDPACGWSNQPLRATPTTLAGHADTARCLAISPDGSRLATGDDTCLLLWDITDPARPVHRRTILAGGPVHAVAFTPDGRQVSSVSGHGRVTTWATT